MLQWLGKQKSFFLDDLASLDPDLYQGLIFLKHYTGNPEDLSLNFTVAIEGTPLVLPLYTLCNSDTPHFPQNSGSTKTIDLGSNIAVMRENHLQCMQLVSRYRLSKQIKLQSEAFFEGLLEMIDTKWLRYVTDVCSVDNRGLTAEEHR